MPDRTIIAILITLLLFAVAGVILAFLGITVGRYLAYFAIPIGALFTIIAAIRAMYKSTRSDSIEND